MGSFLLKVEQRGFDRHTYTTRLLFTCLPSENYAPGGASLECLLESMVSDCNKLYADGFEVPRLQVSNCLPHHMLGSFPYIPATP